MKSDWGETGEKFFVTGLAQILFCPRSFVFNSGPGASHPRRIGVLDHWRMNRMRSLKSSMFVLNFQEVVDRFGRFPQRNKVLGRENTPEEEEWLNNLPDKYKW